MEKTAVWQVPKQIDVGGEGWVLARAESGGPGKHSTSEGKTPDMHLLSKTGNKMVRKRILNGKKGEGKGIKLLDLCGKKKQKV